MDSFSGDSYPLHRFLCGHPEFSSYPYYNVQCPKRHCFLWHFSSLFVSRVNKKAGHTHNRTSRMAMVRWRLFWFVYVTGFHCFKSVQSIRYLDNWQNKV